MTKKRVAVIGAGISGLVCASELVKHGADVKVFEKENEVAGRMLSKNREGLILDTGAQVFGDKNKYPETHRYCGEFGIHFDKTAISDTALFRNSILHVVKKSKHDLFSDLTQKTIISKLEMIRFCFGFLFFFMLKRKGDFFELTHHYGKREKVNARDYLVRIFGEEIVSVIFESIFSAFNFYRLEQINRAFPLKRFDR